MAIRFDASSDSLSRTTSLPTITSFTMMGWFRITTDTNANACFLSLGAAASNLGYAVATDSDGLTALLWNGTDLSTADVLTVGTWYHMAMTVAGTGATDLNWYRDGVLYLTESGNASVPAEKMWVSNFVDPQVVDGRATAVKVWSAALTADEIKAEMRTYLPVRLANLNTWSPLLASTDLGNYAGTGAWTVGGTLTTEDGPPIAWAPAQRLMPRVVAAAVRPMRSTVQFQAVASSVL